MEKVTSEVIVKFRIVQKNNHNIPVTIEELESFFSLFCVDEGETESSPDVAPTKFFVELITVSEA